MVCLKKKTHMPDSKTTKTHLVARRAVSRPLVSRDPAARPPPILGKEAASGRGLGASVSSSLVSVFSHLRHEGCQGFSVVLLSAWGGRSAPQASGRLWASADGPASGPARSTCRKWGGAVRPGTSPNPCRFPCTSGPRMQSDLAHTE